MTKDNDTLPALVLAAARHAPEHPALIDGPSGREVSYETLAARTERIAATLAARGFGPADVLALWAPNMPPWAGVALGAMAAGGAVTGIFPAATEREVAGQLADSEASILVTVPRLAEAAARAGAREVIVIGEALLAGDGPAPAVALDPGALAMLPYSSGTTGVPKGVMLTHRNVLAGSSQVARAFALDARDTVLAAAPFCHVMGAIVTLAAPLISGATIVTMPRFDLEPALALVQRHRVTVLVVPPPIMALLARHPAIDRYDLSSLKLIVSGGAPLGAELQRAVAERLPHAAVGQGYGLTETAVGLCGPQRGAGTVPGSVGRPLAGTELRVVDPATGVDVRAGEPGELWARGPQIMAGYRARPDATAAMITPDGWLRTGDLGRVDADGNVFVLDRLKELIKVNALQVAPAELEALLATHPGVADAAVIPRPDERTGEVPVAVVVARGELDPDALMRWVAERVSPHKQIRAVRVVDQLPRTPAGKLVRRRLVEQDRAREPALAP